MKIKIWKDWRIDNFGVFILIRISPLFFHLDKYTCLGLFYYDWTIIVLVKDWRNNCQKERKFYIEQMHNFIKTSRFLPVISDDALYLQFLSLSLNLKNTYNLGNMLQRLYATSSILNFRPTNFLTYCNIRPTTAVGRFHILIF